MPDAPLNAAAEARRREQLAEAKAANLRRRRPVVRVQKARCAICGSDTIKIDKTLPNYRYAHCLTCEAELFVIET